MIVLPAIDIKDGRCVRLFQGDYSQVTTYDDDPVRVAQRWQTLGAQWLHLVDLDGAAQGFPANEALIARIRQSTHLHIELGGGLRSLASIERILALGIDRVILGTIAITDRILLQEAVQHWPERVVVGIDARDGRVAISGWSESSPVRATELARELSSEGVQRFIYTDIARDGALSGPNFVALAEMQQATSAALIASGGVSSLDDLRKLAQSGVEGAIVGKAIYSGDLDLAQALQELE